VTGKDTSAAKVLRAPPQACIGLPQGAAGIVSTSCMELAAGAFSG